MKLRLKPVAVVAVLATAALATAMIATGATAHDRAGLKVRAKMTGYEGLPTLSTAGKGVFKASLNRAGTAITFSETYSGPLTPTRPAARPRSRTSTSARVRSPAGSAFRARTSATVPAGTPACPVPRRHGYRCDHRGVGDRLAGQGISAGEFAELVRAIRSGNAYVNVHTTTYPAGEIRGQLSVDKRGKH